ncbi:MAG: pyruvate ferredoxin oxidoreductase [Chloroflexi bacterium]|nr:pyruvate ferredoxin oxidoreductase [Chloroflexota bacterium]
MAKGTPVAYNGATLVAHAMRQMKPDVVACYPITPQTILTEAFSEFVANGEVHTEFVPVESEHAAMSTCIGAAAAGARVQTATSGPGLALMWEVLWVASGCRLPIVMHLCTRAFNSPLNILGDHHDMMGMKDTSWIIISAETGQEAYDNAIQAVRIAEHPDVMLPVASAMDGFVTTHSVERCEILPNEVVAEFVGTYKAPFSLLNLENPVTIGGVDFHDYYFEHKRQQLEAMERAQDVARQVAREYGDITGRYYNAVEPYHMDDAEVAIVVMGSASGTIRTVVDDLRRDGVKAGVLRIRFLRPFPSDEIAQALSKVKAAAVLERSIAYGAASYSGLHAEVCTSLYSRGMSVPLESYIYGLGGRNSVPAHFRKVYEDLLRVEGNSPMPGGVKYVDLRD